MDIVLDLLLHPFFGLIQAVIGVIWPSEDPSVLRLQKLCRWTLAATGICSLITILLACFWPGSQVATFAAAAVILLLASGALGNTIESRCKRNRLIREIEQKNQSKN